MTRTTAWIRGIGIGAVAGAAAAAALLPIDKRRFNRSKVGRTWKEVSSAAASIGDHFQ